MSTWTCGNCNGQGEIECRVCGGRGQLGGDPLIGIGASDCTTCGGSGTIECGRCEGSGEIEE